MCVRTSTGHAIGAIEVKDQQLSDLIVFSVSVLSHHSGLFELRLESVHTLLIGDAPVLEHLSHTT